MTVDLYDPDLYVAAPPHEIFAELRRTDPVHFQEMSGEPGYWMVLKHARRRTGTCRRNRCGRVVPVQPYRDDGSGLSHRRKMQQDPHRIETAPETRSQEGIDRRGG